MATGLQFSAVRHLLTKLRANVMGLPVFLAAERDKKDPEKGRIFIQCAYESQCTVTGERKLWKGRKWYLSDHMTEDEIVKTCYAAFKATVEHEVMEGFTFEGQRVFNPHASFRALMEAGKQEIYREAHP